MGGSHRGETGLQRVSTRKVSGESLLVGREELGETLDERIDATC